MSRLAGGFAGFLSSLLTAFLALTVALVALFGNAAGQALLEAQAETLASRMLGPGYQTSVGRQSLSLQRSGRLAVGWSQVAVFRPGLDAPSFQVGRIDVGFDPMPLLAGRLRVRSLALSDAALDLRNLKRDRQASTATVSVPPFADLAKEIYAAVDDRFARLKRLGLDDVALSNIDLRFGDGAHGRPQRLHIRTAQLVVSEGRDLSLTGDFELDGAQFPAKVSASFAEQPARLAEARAEIGPLPLGSIVPPGPEDDPVGRRIASTSDAGFTLRVASNADGQRVASAALHLGSGVLQVGRGHTRIDGFDAALHYLEGGDRIEVGPLRAAGSGVSAAFEGELLREPDGSNGLRLDLSSRELRSSVGASEKAAAEASLQLSAVLHPGTGNSSVDRFEFQAGEGRVSGTAGFSTDATLRKTELSAHATNLSARDVKAFWPFAVAVAPRRWVLENGADAGRVSSATMRLATTRSLERPDENHRLNPDEFDLSIDFAGIGAQTVAGRPRVVDADGSIETKGSDTLVTIGRGAVENRPELSLDGLLVSFSPAAELSTPVTDMRITANVAGPIRAALAAVAGSSLPVALPAGFAAEDFVGTMKAVADIDMSLGSTLPAGHVLDGWKLGVELAAAGLLKPVAGRRLEDVSGHIEAGVQDVKGNLSLKFGGAKASVEFRRATGGEAAGALEAEIRSEGVELAKLAPALKDAVSGPFALRLAGHPDGTLRGDVDLADTELNLSALGWRKGRGVAARLGFEAATTGEDVTLGDIALAGNGFRAKGEAKADGKGLRTVRLDNVALNPGDDVRIAADRMENGYSVAVTGGQFDARPLLNDIRSDLGGKGAEPPKPGMGQLDVSVSLAKVIGFNNQALRDFALNYAGSGSRIAALSAMGRTGDGKAFSVDVSPRGADRSIEVAAGNLGSLIGMSGLYPRMQNGNVELTLVGSFEKGYRGRAEIRNFTLVDEPKLSRLVAAPARPDGKSLSDAIGRNLEAERADFGHASADIVFGRDGLRLGNGIVRGPIFGSSFAGTLFDAANRIDITGSFMPAYGLNRVFGAIPVVGQILGNGREGGLIGITYRLSGKLASPKLEVNPLSAIAPGVFRNIFAYQ